MAMHICNVHQGNIDMDTDKTDIPIPLLKKYIAYARSRVSPRLTEKSANMLTDLYVKDRQTAKMDKLRNNKKHNIPITVRQLEAIIRISEALAKMELNQDVNEKHVNEAHRIFKESTLNAL